LELKVGVGKDGIATRTAPDHGEVPARAKTMGSGVAGPEIVPSLSPLEVLE
jgi:hypothetical protein